jgi:hypothetical protein
VADLIRIHPNRAWELSDVVTQLESEQARTKALEHDWVRFRGAHQSGHAYGRGDAVTRQGSLWIALKAPCGTPGGPEAVDRDWTLAVKRGSL